MILKTTLFSVFSAYKPPVPSSKQLRLESTENVSERMRNIEGDLRSASLRITGLDESSKENFKQRHMKVTKPLTEKLHAYDLPLKNVRRVRKPSSGRPRPIVAELAAVADKVRCFKSSQQLKGNNVYLSDDVRIYANNYILS